ncbi:hypothetical protein [Hymenobacter nivis]|nr:hypothetical protein [Hymenobacter nivis]
MGGLVPGVGNTDMVPAMLTLGEVVMSAPAVQQFAPALSYLNVLAGGASSAPGLPQQRGGQADGGLVARALGAVPAFDYQQLAAAIAQQPVSVAVRAIAVQQGRVARARSLTTLGS